MAWLYILKLVRETLKNCSERWSTGIENYVAESASLINDVLERVTFEENMIAQ